MIFREMVPEAMRHILVTYGETTDKEEDKFLWIPILEEDLELCYPIW